MPRKRLRYQVFHDDERSTATGDGFVSSHSTMKLALAKAQSMGIDGYWYGQFYVDDSEAPYHKKYETTTEFFDEFKAHEPPRSIAKHFDSLM